jgi:uncharacterized protein YdeI (YjbR/CyaY-like superfamily)
MDPDASPRFFRTAAAFRAWLERHHATERELWIGYYKTASGRGGMVYREALDEALCYGWIDGVIRRIDETCYMQRFTPRRKDSTWSAVNTRRVGELEAAGRMQPSGRAAFERRDPKKTERHSYERNQLQLSPAFARQLAANPAARAFFEAQAPWYRRVISSWVMSAKKEETQARRFSTLLVDSAAGRLVAGAVPGRQERAAAPKPRSGSLKTKRQA